MFYFVKIFKIGLLFNKFKTIIENEMCMFFDDSFRSPILPLNGFLSENMRINPVFKMQLNTLLNFLVIWGIYIVKVHVTLSVSC